MAESSWPDPDAGRVVDDRQYEVLAARFSDDGLYGSPSDPAPVYADGSGLQVKVRAGLYGSVRGHGWTSGDEDVTLSVSPNSSGQARTDRVVLRLDRSTWTVRAAVREGTPGAGAPALVRQDADTGVWEVPLARVTVASGASAIGAGDVVSRPLYVGSRIRPQHSTERNPHPAAGEVAYDADTGLWVGWTGSQWRALGPTADTTYNLSPAAGWTADPGGPNQARRIGNVAWVTLALNWTGGSLSEAAFEGRLVTTLPAAVRPTERRFASIVQTHNRYCQLHINPGNGRVEVWHNSAGISNGMGIRATFSYPL